MGIPQSQGCVIGSVPMSGASRPHGTGYQQTFIAPYRERTKDPRPCVGCGTPTLHFYWCAFWWVKRSTFDVDFLARCPDCELKRQRESLERTAANPDVYPRIREAAQAMLKEITT